MFATDRISGEVIQSPPSVCPSVCFHSIFGTDWPLTLNFCMWVGHDHSSQGIEGHGHRSRSWARQMRSVRPRSRAVFLVWTASIFYTTIVYTITYAINTISKHYEQLPNYVHNVSICAGIWNVDIQIFISHMNRSVMGNQLITTSHQCHRLLCVQKRNHIPPHTHVRSCW